MQDILDVLRTYTMMADVSKFVIHSMHLYVLLCQISLFIKRSLKVRQHAARQSWGWSSQPLIAALCYADEQGLGKTVQMLALIVTRHPSRKNAESALKQARRELHVQEFHALGRSARDQRAADEAGGTTHRVRSGESILFN